MWEQNDEPEMMNKNKDIQAQKTINIALQGGGAHGAFAWGVLDKLLEDGRLKAEGFTATSAGTMNALAFTQGLTENGPEGARACLENFWSEISKEGSIYSPTRGFSFGRMMDPKNIWGKSENHYGHFMFDTLTRIFSPYQFNPYNINPLKDVLERTINFDVIQSCDCMKLFISATNVKSGKVKVFKTGEITLDVALASGCLPFIFKAVEVEGEHYWDGGYMGNPSLYPLFYETESEDIVLINLNPIERDEVPTTAPDIMNRVNEISFNASLLKELRAISFVKKLHREDMVNDKFKERYKNPRLHTVRADDAMKEYSVASKFDTDWTFLCELRDEGRKTMAQWLDDHIDNIGVRSSVDLEAEFLEN